MKWINVPKNIEDYFGFCYCITNLIDGRQYIGKKFLWIDKKLPPLKGKKNKRHSRVTSDWRDYWSSSKELLADIDKFGKKNFKREILLCCKTKFDCAYYEAKLQFDFDVLFNKNFYNEYIGCRLRKRK